MANVFMKILNMSIMAGWLVLVVLCVRFLFKKAPKWIRCLLWGLVAIRLICPFSLESPFSLMGSGEVVLPYTMQEGERIHFIPSVNSKISSVERTVNPILAKSFAYEEYESAAPFQIYSEVAAGIWVLGIILMLSYGVYTRMRLNSLVKERVNLKENIYICDYVESPFILGVFRPSIYIPSYVEEEEMDVIIAHEKAHLARKDHWWKLMGYLLLAVYWFQPLFWIGWHIFCKDIELACDEKAVKFMDFSERKQYSRVLVSCGRQRKRMISCPLAFGEVAVKDRVKTVLNYKKPGLWKIVVSLLVCAMLSVCFLTNQREQDGSIADERRRPNENMNMQQEIKNTFYGNRKTYYEMADGTWLCDSISYKYRLEIKGRLNNSARDSVYVYLSNRSEISFGEAWKASGLSSDINDYFSVEDAVLVDWK